MLDKEDISVKLNIILSEDMVNQRISLCHLIDRINLGEFDVKETLWNPYQKSTLVLMENRFNYIEEKIKKLEEVKIQEKKIEDLNLFIKNAHSRQDTLEEKIKYLLEQDARYLYDQFSVNTQYMLQSFNERIDEQNQKILSLQNEIFQLNQEINNTYKSCSKYYCEKCLKFYNSPAGQHPAGICNDCESTKKQITDTERLDFIEKNELGIGMNNDTGWSFSRWNIYCEEWEDDGVNIFGDNLRKLIDIAMKEIKEKNGLD